MMVPLPNFWMAEETGNTYILWLLYHKHLSSDSTVASIWMIFYPVFLDTRQGFSSCPILFVYSHVLNYQKRAIFFFLTFSPMVFQEGKISFLKAKYNLKKFLTDYDNTSGWLKRWERGNYNLEASISSVGFITQPSSQNKSEIKRPLN